MAPAATLMIHEAMTSAAGTAADLRKAAATCEFMSATIANVYSWRSGRSAETWRELMAEETWFSPAEAVSAKLADRVLTPAVSASARMPAAGRRDSRPRRMG